MFSHPQLVEVLHYKTVELNRTKQLPEAAFVVLDHNAIRQLLTQGSPSTCSNSISRLLINIIIVISSSDELLIKAFYFGKVPERLL